MGMRKWDNGKYVENGNGKNGDGDNGNRDRKNGNRIMGDGIVGKMRMRIGMGKMG